MRGSLEIENGFAAMAGIITALLIAITFVVLIDMRTNSAVETAKYELVKITGVHFEADYNGKWVIDGLIKDTKGVYSQPARLGKVTEDRCKDAFIALAGKETLARITHFKYSRTFFVFPDEEIVVDGVAHLCKED